MDSHESKTGIVLAGTALVIVFVAFLIAGFFQIGSFSGTDSLMTRLKKNGGLPAAANAKPDSDFAYFTGSQKAKVTVVEFFDFQCPYSAAMFPIISNLVKRYEGKDVKFVFRHVPIETHPAARDAALASHCAKEQNKFIEMYNVLFRNQSALTPGSFLDFARAAGVPDLSRYQSCIASRRYESVIQNDMDDALGLGVEGTPTFFINGKKLNGAHSEETLSKTIDSEL